LLVLAKDLAIHMPGSHFASVYFGNKAVTLRRMFQRGPPSGPSALLEVSELAAVSSQDF
jgi:hypothetical protein